MRVTATVAFGYNGNRQRGYDREECDPFVGQFVGAVHRQTGTVVSASYEEDGGDPAYLSIDKVHEVWLIRRGVCNRAIEVLPDDAESVVVLLHPNSKPPLPWRFTKECSYDERYRNYMRNEMKTWPRDARGRWLKVPPQKLKEPKSVQTPAPAAGCPYEPS